MKTFYLTTFLVLFSVFANGQLIDDSISMGPQYKSQVFYSLENGEVAKVDNNNWDLGFSVTGRGAAGSAILINESNATLWSCPCDTSKWSTFDTTGYSTWERLLNSDTSWTNGAFNRYRGKKGLFDMGWGILNPANNYWTLGDSLYLIKLSNDSLKKLWIVSLKSGKWEYKYANLDGSNEQVFTLDKANYKNRSFVYHSMITNQKINREPDIDSWDITFTKHLDYLNPPGLYQSVTSVFSHRNAVVDKKVEVDYAAALKAEPQNTSNNISTIGRSWKKYNSSTGWTVSDNIAYFIDNKDSSGYYRLIFTDFEGMGTGKTRFVKEKIVVSSINETEGSLRWAVYPNPAYDNITVLYESTIDEHGTIEVIDLAGNRVLVESIEVSNGFTQKGISVAEFKSGVYVLRIQVGHRVDIQKLVVR
ncbi:MAG: hypothetical protein CL840_19075 [Crocinitomicaceae bacterium]|nr:hypothetical protein [Crocinitomicaceae bacterium]|tara:strand:- start:14551 stop:15807 length:1257 start_codon:yes stop_codon:yes gene_type:complete